MPNAPAQPLIEIVDLTKIYKMGTMEVHALRGVSLTIQPGEYVAIVGTSGSGKSTLMPGCRSQSPTRPMGRDGSRPAM